MIRPRWEIRTEPTESVPIKQGEKPVPGLRIRYRKWGSRGRFQWLVLVGPLPEGRSIVDVVDAYEEKRRG